MADGVVVSRSSPGRFEFNASSHRSSRVVTSPTLRRKRVTPAGPPQRSRSKLAAQLSLCSTAALASVAMLSRPWRICAAVTGECGSSAAAPYAMLSSTFNCLRCARSRMQAARSHLNVDAMANRSCARQARYLPVAVFNAATPIRPPIRCSRLCSDEAKPVGEAPAPRQANAAGPNTGPDACPDLPPLPPAHCWMAAGMTHAVSAGERSTGWTAGS